jgi:outer membrane protein assembly factor BamB
MAVVLMFFITFLRGGAWGAGGDLLWQVDTGGVLAASNGRVVVAGSAGVQAFDGKSGSLLWQDSFFGATTIAMDAQQVIAVGATAIRAYDSTNGTLDWQGPLISGTEIKAAKIHERQLLVAGTSMDATGAVQLLIRAYDAKNGQIQWEDRSLPPNVSLPSLPTTQKSLTIQGGRAYLVATVVSQTLHLCLVRAYDRETGGRVWESVSQERCQARAVAAGRAKVILAGIGTGFATILDDLYVRSYSAQTGALLWQDKSHVLTGFGNAAVAVDDEGKQAFIAGWVRSEQFLREQVFHVRAYDMETGKLYWEDQYPGSVIGPLGRLCCASRARDIVAEGRRVFAVGFLPFIVRAYDARSGNLSWQNEQPTGLAESVAIDRGVVFAADSGVLRAYDAE